MAETKQFDPHYFGTVFNVFYSNDPQAKLTVKTHVITSSEYFELISADWRSSIARFHASNVERVESKKMVVTVSFRDRTPAISLNTKPEPCDSLVKALTAITELPKTEAKLVCLSTVLPTFRFEDKAKTQRLYRLLSDQTVELIQTFRQSSEAVAVCLPLVDIFACLFRFRYSNEVVQRGDDVVRALAADVRRHLVIGWAYSVIHCSQPLETPTAQLYFSRIALHSGRTIERGAKALNIQSDELIALLVAYDESKNPDPRIEAVALAIAQQGQDGIDAGLAATPALDLPNFRLLLNITVIALAAAISGLYLVDLENFAGRVLEYTKAIVQKQNVDHARRTILRVQQAFLRDMLYFLDGQRYDEPFQYVFCTWPYGNMDEAE
jgi:hypothetical protein